jgi:PAS domain S-box-containing protein
LTTETSYRHYFNEMPCYVTVQDRNFNIIDANKRFRDEFGHFEGRHCYQVYKRRSERCEDCPVDRTFRDGRGHRAEVQVKTLDNKDVSMIAYTSPIRNESGEITSVLEISTDITEVKLLQKQLRESQERYRQLFEEVPCYISIQDRNLRIVEANRRFREDFGDLMGSKCYEVYKHREDVCEDCAVQKTFDDAKVYHSEEVVTSFQGERMNTLVYTAPIVGVDGRIKHVMEMSTNITPIRQLQSQLESIGLLISTISHGIKGLLTGLNGGRYLVNTGLIKDDRKRTAKGWEMVERNIDRISSMVLNILHYAKEREPSWEKVSATALCNEVCEIVAARAQEHGIDLQQNLDTDAGEFEADDKAMRSLLVNLLENSIDACRVDSQKESHNVKFDLIGQTDNICFEVRDNGIGMDREAREKAFSLFFSSKGAEGTGLGLFIANNIAQAHSGRIEVESESGKGTCFHVTIPRKRTPVKTEAHNERKEVGYVTAK